ncbi:MAG: MarR family transcriptional regulator [Candidatus Omnitrophica bacterium]|nr:MarR family transcriptional regulator [Candidatus Omnitrophota bacterium]MBU1932504.1 MarR family transcriptional regulator [Candidatus Omnitrophota bacterium]
MATIDEITREISRLIPKIATQAHPGSFANIRITPAQILMLMSIHAHGKCHLKTLARERKVSPPTITGLVDRLLKDGYVRKDPDPEDRRAAMVSLTKKGEGVVTRHLASIQNLWKSILTHLSQKEREQYLGILRKIVNILSKKEG